MQLEESILFFCFFFKQKTAYEITYGDWSSDVCSSDLLPGKIRDHDVGPGASNAGERLHHRSALVQPAELARGLDHGVLPRHRVGRQRHAELALGPRDDVEVRQGRLDHDD